jgi:hypothetical protein
MRSNNTAKGEDYFLMLTDVDIALESSGRLVNFSQILQQQG